MNQIEIQQLIDKFLTGNISPEEQRKLDDWYDGYEYLPSHTDGMRAEEQWEIRSRILGAVKAQAFGEESSKLKDIKGSKVYLGRAAAVMICMMILLTSVWMVLRPEELKFQTGIGEQLTLTLPDSTKVILNGNSSLEYTLDVLGNFDRNVILNGEGFFDVTHTMDHQRFVINKGTDVEVEVYGTTFSYQKRGDKKLLALESGSVKLTQTDFKSYSSLFIRPGEVASYSSESKEMNIYEPINLESYLSWKDGKLILEDLSLAEVLEEIKGSYGLELAIDSSRWSGHKVSGTLPLPRDPKELIYNLENLFNVSIEIVE